MRPHPPDLEDKFDHDQSDRHREGLPRRNQGLPGTLALSQHIRRALQVVPNTSGRDAAVPPWVPLSQLPEANKLTSRNTILGIPDKFRAKSRPELIVFAVRNELPDDVPNL